MVKKVVIVESPSKAKTIGGYLGSNYTVIASMGHVRSLPSQPGSIDTANSFQMIYKNNSVKQVQSLISASKKAEEIYLAMDQDREGEAIAWHVVEILKENKIIKEEVTKVFRIVFTEVTKKAIKQSISEPREINYNLVNAQQARQGLDYLVGFTLSPLLWQKLPNSRSAGRVQSVTLRLICEREEEIVAFKSEEFWNFKGVFLNTESESFSSTLTHIDEEKLDKFYCKTEADSKKILENLQQKNYVIGAIDKKKSKRNPKPPFITSTLQQESSTRLGYSTKNTMMIAQKLYEGVDIENETVGLITYMRTDGLHIAGDALSAIRSFIKDEYGDDYLSEKICVYSSKVKNAQEAHEAIRPTDVSNTPSRVASSLTPEQLKLYTLIWNRTIACQMKPAILDQLSIKINDIDTTVVFTANGSTIAFEGFYKVYPIKHNDVILPKVLLEEAVKVDKFIPEQSFTIPPPRYNEASLVKKMEELGIGRPSTYATIISVIQDRKYVTLENKIFIPEKTGQILTIFLNIFFNKYISYNFTANLEKELDVVAAGDMDKVDLLDNFWQPFHAEISRVMKIKRTDILEDSSDSLKQCLFPKDDNGNIVEICPKCKKHRVKLNIGKFGVFVRCEGHPDCKYVGNFKRNISLDPILVGVHTETNEEVFIKEGPYGRYLQMGQKRASLPKNVDVTNDIDLAVKILSFPFVLGRCSETNTEVKLGIGNYGPYVYYNNKYTSVKPFEKIFSLTLDEALKIAKSPKKYKDKSKKS